MKLWLCGGGDGGGGGGIISDNHISVVGDAQVHICKISGKIQGH